MGQEAPQRVAVVGTGLAGLTAAYLLQNDEEQRYAVTLFEQAESLSFDSASVAIRDEKYGTIERIDLPMRALAGGYYTNVMRMYDHLGIPYHPIRFLFSFAKALPGRKVEGTPAKAKEEAGRAPGEYFVHASNLHQVPPWPGNRGVIAHLVEILYLVVCQFWFTFACFWVHPRTEGPDGGESLKEYLERIWLPRRYTTHYLLPLISSVSTCTHAEMLAFPASDVVNYKKKSHGEQHYTVCGGVHQVESRLAEEMKEVRLGARVTQVTTIADGRVKIHWQSTRDGEVSTMEEDFDRVVLAVSPDVAARIFTPLRKTLDKIPTIRVESSILRPANSNATDVFSVIDDETSHPKACAHHQGSSMPSQVICLRTDFGRETRTEALHTMPGGTVVSTCPLDPAAEAKRVLRTARFTRTLRTTQSRAVIQRIIRGSGTTDKKTDEDADDMGWKNGEDNVWLTGAWCWDGMVLLEGCLISAMRIADDFGRNDIYDVDHWKLNVKVPFTTTWMNMGYWTTADGQPIHDFEMACQSLLHQVLLASGLLNKDDTSSTLAILDLGIGCGDQSLELARLIHESAWNEYIYVGLTLNETQFRLAAQQPYAKFQKPNSPPKSIQVFQADAARPDKWSLDIKAAIETLRDNKYGDCERWVLGLDSLYHFYPSRVPILTFAARDLDASFMAFDLTLNRNASFLSRLWVKLISIAMKCPIGTFMTEAEYRTQLVEAGYDEREIRMQDVTGHVFSGLVNHISRQEAILKPYGISLAKYKVAGKLFGWLERSQALKATIVVALRKSKTS
ncbi:hypothetical protein CGCSCA5_v014825 [Colletotrichum siamense]|nr:hypothetical protein CGCSCA5_v014825 [Colletotrichum siamense]